jgi:amino acid adenylation domain-containing protein
MLTNENCKAATLVDLLRRRADRQPAGKAFTFLADGETEEATMSFAELDRRARAIGRHLRSLGASGERVLLLYPPGLEYITAFFGCMYVGAIAVPVFPPRPNRSATRLQTIARDAEAAFALTTEGVLSRLAGSSDRHPELKGVQWLATDATAIDLADEWEAPAIDGESISYLQYTSGSTAAPKGVIVTHANVLYNSRDMDAGWRHSAESVLISWLPHFHDMGLIYGIIQPVYTGFAAVLMPPTSFLQKPARWLRAISTYGGTHSAAPNFAYELCVRKMSSQHAEGLDLSTWAVAVNGAEPVRQDTLERFAAAFADYGFRHTAFCPGYGLAESTLKVTAIQRDESPMCCRVQADGLARHEVIEAPANIVGAHSFVGCGAPMLETKLAIVHPDSRMKCRADEVGEIWVGGPSVGRGYWKSPELTAAVFQAYLADTQEGPYLRTGDLGFVKDGVLFVTGRVKDIIIIRGRNHYPQDIELTVERSHPSLRAGCGAAFSVDVSGEEMLVVVQEIERNARQQDAYGAVGVIRQAIAEDHELHAHAVVLIKAGTLPKTSSGKVQRRACREAFLASNLDAVRTSILNGGSRPGTDPASIRQTLLAEGREEGQALVQAYLAEQIGRSLGVELSGFDPEQGLGALGIDSLMAVELRNKVEVDLDASISQVKFLDETSLQELAADLLDRMTQGGPIAAAPHVRHESLRQYPLSYGQKSLWYMHELDRESPAYNIAYAARVPSTLDISALRSAFKTLVLSHSSLRTAYRKDDGEPVQIVQANPPVDFVEIDASLWSSEDLRAQIEAAGELPFDLERGRLVRARLFRRTGEDHILSFGVHHIACDFWSLDILLAELREHYEAARGGAIPPPASTAEYADYVSWQTETLAGPEGERLWAYWREELGGELPVVEMYTDRARPQRPSYRGATQEFALGVDLIEEVKALARRQGTTLFTTLVAVFQVLLRRYTQQEEIIVGSPAAGRSRPEFARVVGHFVNPVVLRGDLSGAPSFDDILRRTRHKVLGALAHQDYPLPCLAERLQPERDPSRTPIFHVAFAWEQLRWFCDQPDPAPAGVGGAGLHLDTVLWKQMGAAFDLTMMVLEKKDGLSGSIHYSPDLFDASTISRMARHFKTLLASAVREPGQRIADLQILSEPEREQLAEWNRTTADYPSGRCAHELFEARVKRRRDSVALVSGDVTLTYLQLNRRSNALAHLLLTRGVGPEARVAVCAGRSLEFVIGALAALKAGAAYVPLDPALPADRLAFMVEDAGAAVLLIEERFRTKLADVAIDLVRLDGDSDPANQRDENPPRQVTAGHAAYVIYTSGSTGLPKGVDVSHGGLLNLVYWTQDAFAVTAADRTTQAAGIGFDASVWETWPYLAAGAAVHLLDDDTRTSPTALREYLLSRAITVCFLPTPLAGPFLALDWPANGALRVLLTGGDRLNQSSSAVRAFEFVNNYGPTENTVVATSGEMLWDGPAAASPSIGRPIANAGVYILDSHLEQVPLGVPGELYVTGDSLARGYLGQPQQTAASFIPCRFGDRLGARLYATGDLVRYLGNGDIEFIGRIDHQVKIRGLRIELGEVEAVLGAHPCVSGVVVLPVEDWAGEKSLAAYFVSSGDAPVTTADLRRFARDRLPDYMIPSALIGLESLPLTPNGKIDRRALPPPDWSRPQTDAIPIDPQTPTENVLARVWSEVLKFSPVGVHDNFFDLNGHSLLAIQVLSRVRERLLVDLPLHVFVEGATVSAMARNIESIGTAQGKSVDRIAQIWLDIEGLSGEEIEASTAAQGSAAML